MASTPPWLENNGGYYIKFGDIVSKNDGDACISCVTHEAILDISGPVCIDVGADAGWWSLFCKEYNPSSIIHAFEPNPAQAEHLTHYTSDTFTYYPKAVSNTNSTIRIDFNDSCSHSRSDSGDVVETTTLDFILDTVPKVDIIKIDTEGHDIIIVRSLEPHFNRISSLVFEFTVYWYGASKDQCIQKSIDILELLYQHYPYIYILCRNTTLKAFQITDIDNLMPIVMSLYNNHLQVDIACTRKQITSLEILDETELLGNVTLIC
jgi:FkbM family methyltransferase